MGGGICGGQVIGRTHAEAATVTGPPVNTLDFMATVCRALGIDEPDPIGRLVGLADRRAKPIGQLL